MKPEDIESLSKLTAQERADMSEASFAELASKVLKEDAHRAISRAKQVVASRHAEGREKRTGFAAYVIDRTTLEFYGAMPFDGDYFLTTAYRHAIAAERIDQHTWSKDIADKYGAGAAIKAYIAALTGAESGSIPTDVIRTLLPRNLVEGLDEQELADNNVPGAIIVGDLIFSVSGLHSLNDREIANLIALDSLESVAERELAAA